MAFRQVEYSRNRLDRPFIITTNNRNLDVPSLQLVDNSRGIWSKTILETKHCNKTFVDSDAKDSESKGEDILDRWEVFKSQPVWISRTNILLSPGCFNATVRNRGNVL